MKFLVTALALALALASPVSAQDAGAAAKLAELDSAPPERARALIVELAKLGDEVAAAALDESATAFAAHPLTARRARSQIARDAGGSKALERALERLGDPDELVRSNLVALLAANEQQPTQIAARVAALEQLARSDPSGSVRIAAIQALARVDDGAACAALERLLASPDGAERVAAARSLAGQPRARELLVRTVQRACEPAANAVARRLADDVLATLLEVAYGAALAETPSGGDSVRDRAPFLLAATSPVPSVRTASRGALIDFVRRARALGDWRRGDRMFAELLGKGLDDFDLLELRAQMALLVADDPNLALAAAREVRSRSPLDNDVLDCERRARAAMLEAAALLALDRPGETVAPLDEAARIADRLTRMRFDASLEPRAAPQSEVVELRALVDLYRTLALLAAGREPGDARVLEQARSADTFLLLAELYRSARATGNQLSLDNLFQHQLGPVDLVLNPAHGSALSGQRALELERSLYTVFATVAGGIPGFEPLATNDPRLTRMGDAARRHLLEQIFDVGYAAARAAIGRRLDPDAPEYALRNPSDSDEEARVRVQFDQRRLRDMQDYELRKPDAALAHLIPPSEVGLNLSERLRVNGATAAARKLGERARDDLEQMRDQLGDVSLELALARAEEKIAGTMMDDDMPGDADAMYASALRRLDALTKDFEGNNNDRGVALVRAHTVDVLIGLAVNANVKMRKPEKALEYFERAYALRQDDFTRVLLACYRARAGRGAEARAALRDVPVSPGNFYNLACTWALLGERDLALDYLRRDFDELRTTSGSREHQKQWARSDPDLASLKDDPRFRELVKPAPPPK